MSLVLGSLLRTRCVILPRARDWMARIKSRSGMSVSFLISCGSGHHISNDNKDECKHVYGICTGCSSWIYHDILFLQLQKPVVFPIYALIKGLPLQGVGVEGEDGG